ncbi:MAG: hypothetical protein D8M59_14155 [Planctomycetes bacterium]|nr:hypothetical protein [Planctomycetota bacterium]NOG55475.1 hypothetical protein [Planctomycetota bacterium]
MKRCAIVLASLGLIAGAASADEIADRATLEDMLGGGGTLEDFETLSIGYGGQRSDSSGYLNSDSIFDGSGPGLVQPGADYISPTLWWNGDGYFSLNTQTLADSSGWRGFAITIEYTTEVTAMGIDMQGYSGYAMDGTASVYDTSNNLLGVANVNGGFFGWENADGIGYVVVSANSGYIMIDDHLYGVGDQLRLTVTGDCPGRMTACVTGADPGDSIAIIYGTSAGSAGPVPGCPILFVDIRRPKVAATGTADANGEFCTSGNVPSGACGGVLVQGVDRTTCEKTAVVGI